MRTRTPRAVTAVAAAVLLTVGTGAAASAHDDHGKHGQHGGSGVTTVASGLDNPRGLTVAPDGTIYVAEAGRGGDAPCFEGPEGGSVCFGDSGAITRVRHGQQARVVTGLPSLGGQGDGAQAIGPSDVVVAHGRLAFTVGLGNPPATIAQLPPLAAKRSASLLVQQGRGVSRVADLATYEATADPDGAGPDTNPNSLVANGNGYVAVDAGGNSLLSVDPRGRVRTLATFPIRMVDAPPELGLPPGTQLPMDAVPTSVTRGPDGAYYVGQLTGFPFPNGGANVYRVVPGQAPTVYASGFTNVIDLGFGPDGRLYVLEITQNGLLSGDLSGALLRVGRNGTAQPVATPALTAPGGLTFDKRAAYVSDCSVCAGTGSVLRIPLG
ncbi:ScyD/ScyE family protein [Xylanimonas protaetiae]|uniref:ScyD/ScyE family protein n=1 Tax=Xylanimonas protaetiae TaxID=2509457 RepID=A0A4P6F7L8_9MICO|nr:ScyD/ScyE family protein [Xylanimonas protaetiae]QAY71495.1 ScyD/ScyE family protein [Xylanimonas protaetiae]